MEGNIRKRKKVNMRECSRQFFGAAAIQTENGVEKKMYTCNICERRVNGTNASNLVQHIQIHHKELYSQMDNKELRDPIEEKRLKLLLSCVELVAVNGNAFSRLYDSGLLSMIDTTLRELQAAGRSVNLSDPHLIEVKEMLRKTAKNVQTKIQKELDNVPLSLMVDITTKMQRSILGISVQFIVNGEHKIRSLGMLELQKSHTGEYLAEVICKLLFEYCIRPDQVISITTDNGSNVLKMVRDITTQMLAIENVHQTPSQLNEQSEIIPSSDAEIEEYLENVPDYTDEQILDMLFEQAESVNENELENGLSEEHENLLEAVVSNIRNQSGMSYAWKINGNRCATHSLQLCVTKSLDQITKSNRNVITLCRRVAKTMRLKTTVHELKAAEIVFCIPRLDVVTRWSSTYMMLSDVYKSKHVVDYFASKHVKQFSMLLSKWKTLKEMILVLRIPYDATIALQNPRITLSDVYGIWTRMKIHLEACAARAAYKTQLSQKMIDALNERSNAIFNTPMMECALFLDPRFRSVILIDRDAVERVKINLTDLWNRLNFTRRQVCASTLGVSTGSDDLHLSFDEIAELNRTIRGNANAHLDQGSITDALEMFQPNLLSVDSSVIEFWKKQQNSVLHDLAMAVLSIPPTQVQIERDFSNLSHVFTERRCSLTQDLLEAILLIHLNKEVFYSVKHELLNNERNK